LILNYFRLFGHLLLCVLRPDCIRTVPELVSLAYLYQSACPVRWPADSASTGLHASFHETSEEGASV